MEPRRVTTTWDESLTSENKRHLVRMMWKWPLLGLLVGRSVINRSHDEDSEARKGLEGAGHLQNPEDHHQWRKLRSRFGSTRKEVESGRSGPADRRHLRRRPVARGKVVVIASWCNASMWPNYVTSHVVEVSSSLHQQAFLDAVGRQLAPPVVVKLCCCGLCCCGCNDDDVDDDERWAAVMFGERCLKKLRGVGRR
ncbi:unnamed protein product [Heligmosomoides polygyrus]|uniref:Uncharacterized protein n=1 Tax=Heligmosomoides polygyrus TaxID=6339 RepID=A0A183FLF1_HELPZ|nr:unnamed protein product [Heligmosomoides polygyrus]